MLPYQQSVFVSTLIDEDVMPKCVRCDYPWATVNHCSNCGSENPTGHIAEQPGLISRFSSWLFGWIFTLAVVVGLIYLATILFG